jgi:hypothetical protein
MNMERPVPGSVSARPAEFEDVVDPIDYRPSVSEDGVWVMSETDLGTSAFSFL